HAQDVPRTGRRKDVHEKQRERRAENGGNDEKWNQQTERNEGIERSTRVNRPVRRKERDGHEHDHPARVHKGLEEFGSVQLEPVDWSRDEEVEIASEKEARQRCDDVR